MSEAPTGVINELSQIKREIVDPRTISLRHDKEGRRGVLESAVGAKTNLQDVQMDITKKEQKIQQIAELTSSSAEQERQKVLQLTLRMETLVVKVKKAFGVNDKEAEGLQTEIDTLRSERDSLRADSSSVEADLEALKQGRTEIPKPNELLKAYYEKMLTMPLSNE
jgi:Rps23 Pro-64 3,4-dihydroxylase Tpa1-like proline 4-hydroxylase